MIQRREKPCNKPLARGLVRLLTEVSDPSVVHYLAEGLSVNSSITLEDMQIRPGGMTCSVGRAVKRQNINNWNLT